MPFKKIVSALFGRKEDSAALEPSELDPRIVFENLASALPDTLKYEWDDRFGGVLTAFEVAGKEPILSVVGAQLSQNWDSASIGSAPASIKNAIKKFGGLTSGQQLFACSFSENINLLGLWWPWGNGSTISVRFVPHGSGTSDSELDAVRSSLKGAFGL